MTVAPLGHWAAGALYDYENPHWVSLSDRINPYLGSVITSMSFISEGTVSASISMDVGGVKGDVGVGVVGLFVTGCGR